MQISDFGISRRLEEGRTMQGTMGQGTYGYIAPELMGFVLEKRFPLAADMWSLGAVIFRMLAGKHFLADPCEMRAFIEGQMVLPTQELTDLGLSSIGLDFLQKLLMASPETRLTAEEANLHEWMAAFVATESAEASTTSIPNSTTGSFAGDLEHTEQRATGAEETAQRETEQSKPSAQWSYTAPNPPKLPILDELCLSEENSEGELESSTWKLALSQIREALPVPEAPTQVIPAVKEPEQTNGTKKKKGSSTRRANQQVPLIHKGDQDPEAENPKPFLEVAQAPFIASSGSRRYTFTPTISEAPSSAAGPDADEQPKQLLLECAAAGDEVQSAQQEVAGGKLLSRYRQPTVKDAVADEETGSDKVWSSASERLVSLVSKPKHPSRLDRLPGIHKSGATFISDGRQTWTTPYFIGPHVDNAPERSQNAESENARAFRPRSRARVPSCSSSSYYTASPISRCRDEDSSGGWSESSENQTEDDDSTDAGEEEDIPPPDHAPPGAPQPPSAGMSNILAENIEICSQCHGPTTSRYAKSEGLFSSWGYHLTLCHEICGEGLCDGCWESAVKQFILGEGTDLPLCHNMLALDYDKKRKCRDLDGIGDLYMALKYVVLTDDKHCCTQPECSDDASQRSLPETRRTRTKSGRVWRTCDNCATRYCDFCLRNLGYGGSVTHGHELGKFCKILEDFKDCITKLERNPPRLRGKYDRWFNDACRYIRETGGQT